MLLNIQFLYSHSLAMGTCHFYRPSCWEHASLARMSVTPDHPLVTRIKLSLLLFTS